MNFYTNIYSDLLEDLEENYLQIKNEFFSLVDTQEYVAWPERLIYNSGWNVFGLRFNKNDIQLAHHKCPSTSLLISRHNKLIVTAGFSILNAGTIIYSHEGYSSDVLRCHLGIQIPEGDCGIRVGGEIKKWENGKAFIFDDTITHDAWNRTDDLRTIMLIDIAKNPSP
jgi:ornithine lipid ester-linked acyl 2-hydroxylase